ncbi:imidazole glycerol phosphate synthase subunit HisH [Paenibacillus popilliae]|uniref:Imidazole glycerol phosphate synthase subunit HisH n=1 Tax=Paenibacillus popilliae TaxID=78057 RepID=A0ABY3AN07_PAEPP|nr:imidazole glycerol phosphate synthase subunit HisH [Paenibacillus sp. SDF0028]TQR43224.1 imidazole glycerol phosphate synthase subunit HisH [Paenibacillus sp. SDF0028]
MIAVVDYGMGNLHSVSKAVERLRYEVILTSSREELLTADGIILPGVGAYGDAMRALRGSGLIPTLQEVVEGGKPMLGICLGMQLLFEGSDEHGYHEGLGMLPGRAVRFEGGSYKVPHMGWNELMWQQAAHPLAGEAENGYVYFVHSYRVVAEEQSDVLATCSYGGVEVAAIVGRGSVYGMQFHPEKSGALGLRLLGRFLALTGSGRQSIQLARL